MRTNRKVAQVGCDCRRVFGRITARDEDGRIIWRQRLEHGDRVWLREQLSGWPEGTPVILEGTLGWRWLSDEMLAAGRQPVSDRWHCGGRVAGREGLPLAAR